MILEELRNVYMDVAAIQEQQKKLGQEQADQPEEVTPSEVEDMPPLQVIFGLEQLQSLINGVLSPEEKLGRLALSTQSRSEAARGQFLDIARKLSSEMGCNIEVEDLPDEYTVWLYGSRRQIGALMRELAPRG